MECDREELLANFQACTGIDDVGEALVHLEETNWNLLEAVNRVIPQDSQVLPPGGDGVQFQELPVATDGAGGSVSVSVAVGDDSGASAADSVPLSVMYYGRLLPISLPGSESITTLKLVLQAQLGLAPCQQDLRLDGLLLSEGSRLLSTLPPASLLTLQQGTVAAGLPSAPHSGAGLSDVQYLLTVNDLTTGRQLTLPFAADATVARVKEEVANLTQLAVPEQSWSGWPALATDQTTLIQAGIDRAQTFSVNRQSQPGSSNAAGPVVELASDTSSVDFLDASEVFDESDDVLFMQDTRPKRVPLVPEDTDDEMAGVLHFIEQFEARYGVCCPPFYQGTLSSAAEEACTTSVDERRMMAIYLHHDGSVLSNVFCSQLLCAETIVSYLTNNFVVWGWDITFPSNQNRFMDRVASQFGARTREALLVSMDLERLPLLLLLMRSRGGTEVLSVVHGNTSVDELMSTLMHTHELFTQQMAVERREETERRQRETVMQEQDLAYQQSLLADRAKEEARQAEKEEQERLERDRRKERERQESLKQQEEAVRQAVRNSLESDLPEEPSEDSAQPITTIRIRGPDGSVFCRRFLQTNSLQTLLNYVTVQGYAMDQYKLIGGWPRRDVSGLDREASLAELKLVPQETLMLEER